MQDTDDRREGKGENGEQLTPVDGGKPTLIPVNPLLDPAERKCREEESRRKSNESTKRAYKLGRKK